MQNIFSDRSSAGKVTPKLEQVYRDLLNNEAIGFVQIPSRPQLFEQSQDLVNDLKMKYSQFVVIGIGGSSMGSRALVEMSGANNIFFLENVDSFEFQNLWKNLSKSAESLKSTAFIVISKSGSTIEILWNYSLLEKTMKTAGLSLIESTYFITENSNNNPIAKLAAENKRPLVEIPQDVGGRFSVLTPVGLIVAGLCGYNLKEIQAGAAAARENSKAVLDDCADFLESFARNEVVTIFWFYSSAYRWFGAWIQQLWAESLGKEKTRDGEIAPSFSIPVVAIGACDQHSILQQVAHGTLKNKYVCFYSFQSAENSKLQIENNLFPGIDYLKARSYGDLIRAQARATQEALKQNSVSTQFVRVDDQNISLSAGYLFMHFELVVAVLGLHENINPFDQPGVALGKDLTLKILKK